MRVVLHVTAGPNAGHSVSFDTYDRFAIGRAESTDVRLPHKDLFLSRHHFVLEVNPPLCRVMDVGSRNGTFVNGERITQAVLLKDRDKLKAGHTEFEVFITADDDSELTLTDQLAPPLPATTASHSPTPEPFVRTQVATGPPPIGGSELPVVAGYRVAREIGRGAMGAVYEAVRESDGQTVALKVIRPGVTPSARDVALFRREIDVLRQLDHPAVVRFLDTGEAGGLVWVAMEYIDGTDAARKVKADGPMPVKMATRIVVNVLRGLAHAHKKRFVHRDVKPSNILLYRPEHNKVGVKLADFGLARVYQVSRMSGLTMAGDIGGTPAFMPPEQITDFRNVGPPADIYSTAATLYYLLTGSYVFDLPNDRYAAVRALVEQEVVPIRDRRSDLPEELAAAIHIALAKEPAARPASAEEFAKRLLPFAE